MSKRRLTKSNQQWIDGVLGGLANYIGINPDLLRVGVILAFFLLDLKFLFPVYFILLIIMPEPPDDSEHEEEATFSKTRAMKSLGIILLISGIYYLLRDTLGWTTVFYRSFFNNLDYYLREINRFFSPIRGVLIAVFLVVAGLWLINRKGDS